MNRWRYVLTKPFPGSLRVLPGGALVIVAFYGFGVVVIHVPLVYLLVTGRVLSRQAAAGIEDRASSPLLYGFQIAVFGLAVLLVDGSFLYAARRAWRARQRDDLARATPARRGGPPPSRPAPPPPHARPRPPR